MKQNSDILIYRTKDNEIRIETRLKDETVWLKRHQLAELFNRDIKTIGVTTHVVRLKLFRLKAEGVRRSRLPYFGGNI